MTSSAGSILFKTAAVLLAVGLSTAYIVSQWPESETATSTKPGPSAIEQEASANNPSDTNDPPVELDLLNDGTGFDLNDALSKTGTIKADKVFGDDQADDKADQPPDIEFNKALPKSSPLNYNIGNFIGGKEKADDEQNPSTENEPTK